jgi:hypothetical protein
MNQQTKIGADLEVVPQNIAWTNRQKLAHILRLYLKKEAENSLYGNLFLLRAASGLSAVPHYSYFDFEGIQQAGNEYLSHATWRVCYDYTKQTR